TRCTVRRSSRPPRLRPCWQFILTKNGAERQMARITLHPPNSVHRRIDCDRQDQGHSAPVSIQAWINSPSIAWLPGAESRPSPGGHPQAKIIVRKVLVQECTGTTAIA